MIRYVFDEDEPVRIKAASKADPQVIGEALASIAERTDGVPDPSHVVNAARDEKSPLHQHFEWDDAKAAHAHRLDQARGLIRLIRVQDEETGQIEPAYINISTNEGRSYQPVEKVKRSADLQLALLKQARRELDAWTKRYHTLRELCAEVADVRDRIDARIAQQETRAAA